jgi:membrane-associated phospholipid phosphatase
MIWLINLDVFSVLPVQWRILTVVGAFVFTCAMPVIPIYILIRKGEISDMFIRSKEQRTMPYVFSILSYLFWAFFLLKTLQLPFNISIMGFGSVLSIVVMMFINLKWKISAHLCSMGALMGFVSGTSYVLAINPFIFIGVLLCLTALVALSRIELKAHTPLQTLAGFTVGFLCVFLPCFLFF